MRSVTLALAVGAIVFAGSAWAQGGNPMYSGQSIVTGDVSLAFGWYEPDNGDGTGEILGDVRIAIPITELWNTQIEVAGISQFEKGYSDAYGAYAHFYYKDPQFAIGGLVGGTGINDDGGWTVGAEKAFFMPTTTLKTDAIYTWSDDIDDYWSIGGELGWYWNANTRADFGVRYWSFNKDIWQLSAGVEHLIGGTNLSLFGNASYYGNDNTDNWEVIAGGRFAFGRNGATLQQHDWDRPFSVGLHY
ncbi:MAG: hypothetical protein GY798_02520 [Hyphomicrobiales bacterium]|nr:hypothetical protein [Hyphomicrobiales bacterium]